MASLFSTARGYLCLAANCLFILIADLIQRTVIVLSIRLFPARKQSILDGWLGFIARFVIALCRYVGGARFDPIPNIPADENTLLLMNHQSLLDIPVSFRCTAPHYPRLVTRSHYGRFIPLISHMIRLCDFPTVDPVRFSRRQLDALRVTAARTDTPMGIFPEGTRTKNGEIGRFRTAGSAAILSSRPWTVYLLLIDGLLECAKIGDFTRKISKVHAKFSAIGPLQFDPDRDDPDRFLDETRSKMIDALARLRRGDTD